MEAPLQTALVCMQCTNGQHAMLSAPLS